MNILKYGSLAELYDHYIQNFVAPSPIVSACGCRIHCYEHHFVHMVKLFGPEGTRLYFPDEKQKILATQSDFGHYTHEARRAGRLSAFLDCLRNPDTVIRPTLETADRAFIKKVDGSKYPYVVVLVNRVDGMLTLCTGQPIRGRNINRWLTGQVLYPETAQPPAKVAV